MENKKFKEIFDRYKVLRKLIKKKPIIFDIGANKGQTILEINKHFPNSIIHSFEPILDCKEKIEFVKKKAKKVKVFLNFVAVGEKNIKNKVIYKNISSNLDNYNTTLSSFYKINTNSKLMIKMKRLSKSKKYLKGINIPKKTNQIKLDDYIKSKKINKIDLLKIDTQGYEKKVLEGCKKNIKKINIIVVEICFWDYYKSNSSFYEVEKVIKNNFVLWDISFIYKNPKWNSTDYVDAIYINKSYLNKILKKH
jgi:FkbM family methyltransferase